MLLVEDDPAIRESIREILEAEGYRVVSADNGATALCELAETIRPCVILLDLMMPTMDGWQVLEQLAADEVLSTVPVLVISAVGDELAARGVPVLRKPVHLDALLERVERCKIEQRDGPNARRSPRG